MSVLSDEIDQDPEGKGYAAFLPDQPGAVVELLNAKTETLPKERIITSRGIASVLGLIEGENFLQALEAFAIATLAETHPLFAYQPGIKRQIAWLSTSGLDLGDPLTRALLDMLAAAGIITTLSATKLKDAALKPASRAEVLGLPYVTEEMLRNR
jgi:hypothetical protein